MALLGGRLFAGALFAGALLGAGTDVAPPIQEIPSVEVFGHAGASPRKVKPYTPDEIKKWYHPEQIEAERNLQAILDDDEEVLLIVTQAIGALYG